MQPVVLKSAAPSGSSALQPSRSRTSSSSGALTVTGNRSSPQDAIFDDWHFVEARSRFAAGYGKVGQVASKQSNLHSSGLVQPSVDSMASAPLVSLDASMADWLLNREQPDPAGVSRGNSLVQTPGTGLLPDTSLTLPDQHVTATAAEHLYQEEWAELNLEEQPEVVLKSSGADTIAAQYRRSSSSSSASLQDLHDAVSDSHQILAHVGGGQKANWAALATFTDQVTNKGCQLSSQVSLKGKQLMQQAQMSAATAVGESGQAQASQLVQKGAEAVQQVSQQVSQQLPPQATTGATAMVRDVQLMTAGVKEATADLTNMARSWWQRRSTGN